MTVVECSARSSLLLTLDGGCVFFFFFFFQAEDGIRDLTVTEFRRVLFRFSWHRPQSRPINNHIFVGQDPERKRPTTAGVEKPKESLRGIHHPAGRPPLRGSLAARRPS